MTEADTRGAELEHALEQAFVTAEEEVHVGELAVTLLRPRNADDLISEADYVMDERLPYWADVWPSSLVLAERVLERTSTSGATRRMLELGSGLGLVTLCGMHAGYEVLATDYYADALRFTRVNGWRAVGREPATREVNWRHLPDDLGRFDLVVASDVLYEHTYGELVAETIARTLAPGGVALIADPGRIAAPAFLDACRTRGLELVERPTYPFTAGEIHQRITVYRFTHVPRRGR